MSYRTRLLPTALITALLALLLSACGGGSTSHQVSGLRDDVRHTARKSTTATRPRLVQKCRSRPERVKHSSTAKSKGRKTTRTWYTTEQHRDCQKVKQGTESYSRTLRAERFCVELDDVDGDTSKDDVWYRVGKSTYDKAAPLREGRKLSFTPQKRGC